MDNYRRKFRCQTSDNMDRWKAEMGRVREEKRKEEEERISKKRQSEKRRSRCAKGRKAAKHCVFPMVCGSGRSKSRLAKAAGTEQSGQMRDDKLHAVEVRGTFASENAKNTSCSEHFWKLTEKVHTVVERSTFPSQNAQNTPFSDHFWKLRCWKSARRCGAEQISKSKCTKLTMFRPLLEVDMSKKCTPLWREAHFKFKSVKNWRSRSTFGSWHVEKVHAIVARSTCRSQNVKSTTCSDHFWTFRCRFAFQLQPHTTLHSTTLQLQLRYITLHYTNYIALYYTTPHSTTLHCTPLH